MFADAKPRQIFTASRRPIKEMDPRVTVSHLALRATSAKESHWMAGGFEHFSRFRTALLIASLVGPVAACDGHSDANKAAPEVTAQNQGLSEQTTGPPVREQGSGKSNGLYGVWRVTGVALTSDGPTAFSKNDPLIMGSEITINAESLSWTKLASAVFTADDKCSGPHPAPVTAEHALERAKPEFSGALAQFAIDPDESSAAQRWLCDRGGSWGPDADEGARVVIVGKDRMVMGWYDGVVLLVERVGS